MLDRSLAYAFGQAFVAFQNCFLKSLPQGRAPLRVRRPWIQFISTCQMASCLITRQCPVTSDIFKEASSEK